MMKNSETSRRNKVVDIALYGIIFGVVFIAAKYFCGYYGFQNYGTDTIFILSSLLLLYGALSRDRYAMIPFMVIQVS